MQNDTITKGSTPSSNNSTSLKTHTIKWSEQPVQVSNVELLRDTKKLMNIVKEKERGLDGMGRGSKYF